MERGVRNAEKPVNGRFQTLATRALSLSSPGIFPYTNWLGNKYTYELNCQWLALTIHPAIGLGTSVF